MKYMLTGSLAVSTGTVRTLKIEAGTLRGCARVQGYAILNLWVVGPL